VLDMLELYVVQDTARAFNQFKGKTCSIGLKPLLSFSGSRFDSSTPNQYTLAKSIFLDFFRGGEAQTIDVEGFQVLISFAVGEDGPEGELPKIHMRCWRIVTKRSGQKLPRVEVEEMGPRVDFAIGRIKEAQDSLWKAALMRSKELKVLDLDYLKTVSNLDFVPLGKTEEKCRNGHCRRQSGKDPSRCTRVRRSPNKENERVKEKSESKRGNHRQGKRFRRNRRVRYHAIEKAASDLKLEHLSFVPTSLTPWFVILSLIFHFKED
jgi:hypothetical protein